MTSTTSTPSTSQTTTAATSTTAAATSTTPTIRVYTTTTPYIPARNFPPVIENRYRINYRATCNHYWQFGTDLSLNDLGSRDTFIRSQVNRRRDYFRQSCLDSQQATTSSPLDRDCCVACQDEDLLVNVPGYNSTVSNITNPLNGIIGDSVALETGLDAVDFMAARFVGSASTCILLGRLVNEAPYGRLCLQRPAMCDYGLSASVWVNYTEENYAKEVLLTTISANSQGFQFYTESGKLSLVIFGAKGRWQASVDGFERKIGSWRLLGFTWERPTGIIRIYIDSTVTTFYYMSTYTEPNTMAPPATEIRMGCEILSGGSSASHLKAAAIHPAIWLWPIHEENLILLTGALVYKLIKYQGAPTTPVPTTPPKPDFAYSTILSDIGYPIPLSNPIYEVADFYLRAGVAHGAFDPVTASTNITVTNWLRGRQVVQNFYVQSSPAQFTVNGTDATCTTYQTLCSDGISWSIWLIVTQPLASGDLEFLRFNIFSLSLKSTGASDSVLLQVQAGNRFQGCLIRFQQWSNLGLVYDIRGSSPTIFLYVNGLLCGSSNVDSRATIANYNGNITLGSSAGIATPTGLVFNHLSVWHRLLEDFEVHRFMGYTRDQLRFIRNASMYWTTDPIVNSDSLFLRNTDSYNLKSLYRLDLPNVIGGAITVETDRYNKSLVARLNSNWLAQFFLGNDIQLKPMETSIAWNDRCITDPYQRSCQISGLTMHMWIKIKSVHPSKKQFFFSSGDFGDSRSSLLDSRGISLFTTGSLLGASLSTNVGDWTIVIDSNRFGLDEWFNMGFTWKQHEGLRLFLNGTDYSIYNQHADVSYKSYDKRFRAVVGRFDHDQNSTWRNNSDWVMGNFSFTDLVFYERWLSPDEFARAVGSINNRYYAACDLLIWGEEIVDTQFLLLKQARLLSVPIGPSGNVSKQSSDFTRIGMSGQVGIKAFRADECPRMLSACTNSIIVTVWIKLQSKNSGISLTVLSLGNEVNLFEGFGLSILGDFSLMAWTKRAGSTVKMISRSAVKIRLNRWVNLALHLSKSNLHPTIFLNGTNVSTSLEYRTETPGGIAYQPSSTAGTLTVGRANVTSTPGISDSFLLYLVGGWYETALTTSQLNNILGVQQNQFDLMRVADEYWTVSGFWSRIQPYSIEATNTYLSRDKYDTENGAICSRGTGGSYIAMGNLRDTCLVDTTTCMAFILTLNVKPSMPSKPGRAYLLSTGGQNPGSLGAAISLTQDGLLYAIVRSPNKSCETSVPFNYSDWVQLQIRWYRESVIIVKINDVTFNSRSGADANCWQEVNTNATFSTGHLGKANNNATNASTACFSDVMFKYQPIGSSAALEDLGPSNCYEKQTTHLPMHYTGNLDHKNQANRSRLFTSTESVDLGTDVCLFSGSGCSKGLTVSFWLQVQSLSSTDYVEVMNTGYPSSQGLRVRVKKVMQDTSVIASYMILAEGNIAGITNQVEIGARTEQQTSTGIWVNIGVSFSSTAIEIYVNGVQVRASTRTSAEILPLAKSSVALLGSASAVVLMSNLVFWNEPPLSCLDPSKNKKVLMGDCATVTDRLLTSCMPSNAGTCQNGIENGMCLDNTFDNVATIGSAFRVLSNQIEAATACRVVAGTAETGGFRSDSIQASVAILGSIATNLVVPGSVNIASLGAFLAPFSHAFSAVMNPGFSGQFQSLITSGQINPASLFAPIESLALRLAAKLPSSCVPIATTQGRLHWSTQLVNPACGIGPIDALHYTDLTRSLWDRATDSVLLPRSLFVGRSVDVKVACIVYDLTDGLLASDATNETITSSLVNGSIVLKVNSRIVSLITSVPSALTKKLTDPLNFTLQLKTQNYRRKNDPSTMQLETRCVFWDTSKAASSNFGRGMWSTEGCFKLSEDELSVSCSCYHTTSFAVLMQPTPVFTNNIHSRILSWIAYILTCLSLVCLLIFFIIVVRRKQLHRELYILHLNMAGALFIALIAFVLTDAARDNDYFCKAISIVMHLFFVAAMCLLLAGSIWLFHAVVHGVIRGRLKWLLPAAWLLPVAIVAAVGGFDHTAFGGQRHCWLSGIYIWAFLGPLVVFGCLALLVCLVVVCNLSEQAIKRKDIQTELSNQGRHCALLVPIMTLPWLLAVPMTLWYNIPIHYLFVICNASQGIWLFLCLGLINPDFREAAGFCVPTKHKHLAPSAVARVTGIEDITSSRTSFGTVDGACTSDSIHPVYHTSRHTADNPEPRASTSASQQRQQHEQDHDDAGGEFNSWGRRLRDSQKSLAPASKGSGGRDRTDKLRK